MSMEPTPGRFLTGNAIYRILEFIGEGCYGQVANCLNTATGETVAIKLLKEYPGFYIDMNRELSMLDLISELDADRSNVVRFYESFRCLGRTCLVFEKLDMNIYDMLTATNFRPLSVREIRPVAQQLLVALDALKGLGVLHSDIKPDNVMFVDSVSQPLKVKLIDFGVSLRSSEVQQGMEIQPVGYRAPEVTLGLPLDEAIDVWGVGCILALLYLTDNLFSVDCEYQMMKSMVEVLGKPDDALLLSAMYTENFFCQDEETWRVLTPDEYEGVNGVRTEERRSFFKPLQSLDDLLDIYPTESSVELEDRKAYVDLLKRLLEFDPKKRISPHEALQHPFITMAHLSREQDSAAYLNESRTLMGVCILEDFADIPHPPSASSPGQESSPWSQEDGPGEEMDSVSVDDPTSTDDRDQASSPGSHHDNIVTSCQATQDPDDTDVTLVDAPPTLMSGTDQEGTAEESPASPCGIEEVKLLTDNEDKAYPADPSTDSLPDLTVLPNTDCLLTSDIGSHAEAPSNGAGDDRSPPSAHECQGASEPPSRASMVLQRISRFFQNIADTFCCCFRGQED